MSLLRRIFLGGAPAAIGVASLAAPSAAAPLGQKYMEVWHLEYWVDWSRDTSPDWRGPRPKPYPSVSVYKTRETALNMMKYRENYPAFSHIRVTGPHNHIKD